MKNAKLLHVLLVAVLVLLTAVISVAVIRIGRTMPVPVQDEPAAQSSGAAQTETASEPASAIATEAQWIPEIVYDDYQASEIDPENFRSTVILGNSQAQALSNFGYIKNADFVTRVGMSILHVLSSDSGNPPIAQLYGKHYDKAVLVFGENELGWPYPKNFIVHYKKVIDKVRELNPGVEIYCQAIFPVSAEHSAKSTTGTTNENVRVFNALIREMCDEIGAHYMPVSEAFFDSEGALPADAAHDGVHFGPEYCKIWAGDLSAYLQSETPAATETEIPAETTEEGVTQA